MAKLTGGNLAIDSPRETEASGEDDAGGVADAAGPRRSRAKNDSPGAPERPPARRVRVGSAGANFGPNRRKWDPRGRDWADFFDANDQKIAWGALLRARLEML